MTMIKRVLWCLLVFVILFISRNINANDSAYSGDGVDVFPLESSQIQMIDEIITITDKSGRNRFVVDVKMTLKNHGPKTSVQLGFPILADDIEGERIEFDPHFQTWVNGKEVQIKRKRGIPHPVKDYPYFSDDVFTYQVTFNEGETVIINHKYAVGGTFDSLGGWDFTYILRTGALWKDSINSLTIIYKAKASIVKEIYKTQPPEQKREQHGELTHLIWHFSNYEPKSDFKIKGNYKHGLQLSEGMSYEKAVENLLEYYKNKKYDGNERIYTEDDIIYKQSTAGVRHQIQDAYLLRLNATVLRNEIFARHGRTFKTPELTKIFESASWYRPKVDFKDADLNDIERKNVEFIIAFERNKGWR